MGKLALELLAIHINLVLCLLFVKETALYSKAAARSR